MKILFNCLNFKKGGAERVISTLANKFIDKNDVTILTLMNLEDMYDLNKNVKRIQIDNNDKYTKFNDFFIKLSFNRIFKLYREIINDKPDVIISFLPEPSLRLMLIRNFSRKLKRIPIIISIRTDPSIEYKNCFIRLIMKKLYKNVDGMVFQTRDAKSYFDNLMTFRNVEIIPNPVNKKFVEEKPYSGIRDKIIVSVGRLEKQKNHMLLIDAFAEVLKRYPEYQLHIYGDGKIKNELNHHIEELSLTNKVVLKGQVDDVGEKIRKSSIFVLSSNYEGMPNALIEAMCIGLPCISSKVSGAKDLIDDGVNGVLFDINNKEQLVSKICSIIENKELSNKLSLNSPLIYDLLNEDRIVKKWYDFILKVKNEKGGNDES